MIKPYYPQLNQTIMAFMKFVCQNNDKDPLLDQLYKIYQATPFLPPTQAYQPLQLIGHRDEFTENFGPFSELLSPSNQQFEVQFEEYKISPVELKRSMSFNLDLGLKLVDAMIKGYKINMNPLEGKLMNARNLSLSLQNVRKTSVPNTVLGSALTNQKLNLEHASIDIFRRPKNPLGMYIIGSIFESNAFTLHFTKDSLQQLEMADLDVGKIVDAGFEIKYDRDVDLKISYQGEVYHTFAFSCYKLTFNDAGKISIYEESIWRDGTHRGAARGNTRGDEDKVVNAREVSLLTPGQLGILTWDQGELP